jgi:hypothetical protein
MAGISLAQRPRAPARAATSEAVEGADGIVGEHEYLVGGEPIRCDDAGRPELVRPRVEPTGRVRVRSAEGDPVGEVPRWRTGGARLHGRLSRYGT